MHLLGGILAGLSQTPAVFQENSWKSGFFLPKRRLRKNPGPCQKNPLFGQKNELKSSFFGQKWAPLKSLMGRRFDPEIAKTTRSDAKNLAF